MKEKISCVIKGIAEVFFPQICVCCNIKVYSSISVCLRCLTSLPFLYEDIYCDGIVRTRLADNISINSGYALFTFKKGSILQKIIHAIKYSGNESLALELGKLIGRKIKLSYSEIDIILPVPLHKNKKALRGYNQSELIAQGVSLETGVDVNSNLIYRVKNTQTQTNKDRDQRMKNVENVFDVREKDRLKIVGKKVLLIDDVLTTGATVTSCAHKLIDFQVDSVGVAVLAAVI